MIVSANEIFQMARKACLACRIAHDRAEDIANGVIWLQQQGLAGCAALDDMLAATDPWRGTTDAGLRVTAKKEGLFADYLRPAYEGVAVIDWLLAQPEGRFVFIKTIADPLIFAGLLGRAGHIYSGWFTMVCQTSGAKFEVKPNALSDCEGLLRCDRIILTWLAQASCGDRPEKSPAKNSANTATDPHTKVDAAIWHRLTKRASLTYVPATQKSRLAGAGAGLVDND